MVEHAIKGQRMSRRPAILGGQVPHHTVGVRKEVGVGQLRASGVGSEGDLGGRD